MKKELVLIGTIMLCAQIEGQMAKVKQLENQLRLSNYSMSIIGSKHVMQEKQQFKFRKPVNVLKLTSPYGYREFNNPFTGGQVSSNHMGLDIVGDWHCEVKPIAMNGEVIDVWPVPNGYFHGHDVFGAYVRIKHNDGWISGYGHLSAIYVKEGDKLIDGDFYRNGRLLGSVDVLGRQGNTGQSTGEHLHLSIQDKKGNFVNPIEWVEL